MDTPSQDASKPSLSIIVPTYQEAENLPGLLERIDAVRREYGLSLEVLIMDDDSQDGTEEVIAGQPRDWVRLVVRKTNRGLSAAVLDGFRQARNDVLLVMDADLSHPPEKIPEMLEALCAGADFVLGSRYVPGGGTDEEWGFFRWVNSRAATLLAFPFTSAKDPMSGFFAIRRETFDGAGALNPIGYKIGLEILVKCNCQRVEEIPIHFSTRRFGKSKLSLREQVRYLQHLRRLLVYKYGNWAHFAQFAAVGFSGTLVNLTVLTLFLWLEAPVEISAALAIYTAMLSNFVLNRRFTFSYARGGSVWRQLIGFVAASSVGALVNYCTVLTLVRLWLIFESVPQLASIAGILAGLTFNFFVSRYFVFVKPRTEKPQDP